MVDPNFNDLAKNDEFASLQYAGIGLIVIGSIIMLVGFFGCCGAIRESQCLLVMFFICMLLLFLVLVAAGVASLVFKDGFLVDVPMAEFEKGVDSYEDNNAIVDLVQSVFKCCGKTNSADYTLKIKSVPDSCELENYATGCSSVVPDKIREYVIVVAGVALGSGAVMLLGMIFSMMLCCAIRDME